MKDKIPEPKKLLAALLTPNGTKILLIAGIAGIALIFLSELLPSAGSKAAVSSAVSSTASTMGISDYTKQTEQKVAGLISSIQGVGKAEVMVTFENGIQNVYEQDQKQTTGRTEQTGSGGDKQVTVNDQDEATPVIINNDSGGQQTVLQKQLMPTVLGIVVVCDGGDNADVQEAVTNALTAAFDVPANHIFITKRTSSAPS